MPEKHNANRSADTDLTLLAEQQAGEQGLNSLQTAGLVPAPPSMALSQLPAVGWVLEEEAADLSSWAVN